MTDVEEVFRLRERLATSEAKLRSTERMLQASEDSRLFWMVSPCAGKFSDVRRSSIQQAIDVVSKIDRAAQQQLGVTRRVHEKALSALEALLESEAAADLQRRKIEAEKALSAPLDAYPRLHGEGFALKQISDRVALIHGEIVQRRRWSRPKATEILEVIHSELVEQMAVIEQLAHERAKEEHELARKAVL